MSPRVNLKKQVENDIRNDKKIKVMGFNKAAFISWRTKQQVNKQQQENIESTEKLREEKFPLNGGSELR